MLLTTSNLRIGFLLLVGATAAAGVLSVRLLRHEEERVAEESMRALRDRAQVMADDLRLSVEGVQEDLLDRVAAMPTNRLGEALEAWSESQPLVRNTFVWNPATRQLAWPDSSSALTAEGRNFLQRYERFFASGLRALLSADDAEGAAPSKVSPRAALQRAARERTSPAHGHRRGWIPWFEGDQLFLLGWLERDDRVAGLELETASLLSRLVLAFPRESGDGRAWALLDGAGRILCQSGAGELASGARPVLSASLGPTLPHWEVALYGDPAALAGRGGRARLASWLLVASLLVAMLAGGALLLWEAGRRTREARQKTTFVSNVSHELKTPLTTLRLYAELLRDGRVPGADKQRHYLGVMIGECERLGRLVNNMLDFSRLEQRRRAYAVETVDLAPWLESFLEPQRLRFAEAGIALDAPRAPSPLNVLVDRDALEQALLNLLDNALKYAASGGSVEIALGARADTVCLDVNDRGPGVPEALREKIFENFYRIDAALTARVAGCGLGLSLARRMMRDLGGDVRCLPREGGGACFRIEMRRS